MKRNYYNKRKLIKQKIMGVILLLICVAILVIAATGTLPEERNATAVLLLAPFGLYLLFTKNIVIH